MSKKALLIIGDGNTGKSSIIAALTGYTNPESISQPNCNKRIVNLRDKYLYPIRVLVYRSSPQERGIDPNNFLSSNMYSCIVNANYDLLIMPLQIKPRRKPWAATNYIQILSNNANISDIRVVILHQISTNNVVHFNNLVNYLNNRNIKYINLVNVLQINNQKIYMDPFISARIIRMLIWPP